MGGDMGIRKLGVAVALLLAGCSGSDPVDIEVTTPTLSGHWVGSTPVALSSGGSYDLTLDLTLSESGGFVTGSGFVRAGTLISWTVVVKQGTNSHPSFSLVLDLEAVEDMTYSGTWNSGAELLGQLNGSGFVGQWLVLRRT